MTKVIDASGDMTVQMIMRASGLDVAEAITVHHFPGTRTNV